MSHEFAILFEVVTALGFTARTSPAYWQRIVTKHPDMQERLEAVKQTLAAPVEIRRSSRDPEVVLFYLPENGRWLVVVARRLDGDGLVVTAYRTDARKEGEVIWRR